MNDINKVNEECISYYDLLTLLQNNKQPKEVELNIMNNKALYIFDIDNGYILKNLSFKNNYFNIFLGDSLTDFQKLYKLIKIIK